MRIISLLLLFLSASAFATQDEFWWWDKISYKKTLPMKLGVLELDLHLKSEFSESTKNIEKISFVLNGNEIQIPDEVLATFDGINPSSSSLSTSHIDEGFSVSDVIFTARFEYGYPNCVRQGSISIRSTGYASHMITGEQVCS